MHQQELKTPGRVLDGRGIIHPGWAARPVQVYRRADIKASPLRIKEWDFYQVSDREKCLQFTSAMPLMPGRPASCCSIFETER